MKIDSGELLDFLTYQRNHSHENTFNYDAPYMDELVTKIREDVYESIIEWVEEREDG